MKIFAFVVVLGLLFGLLVQQKPLDTAQDLPTLPGFAVADVAEISIHQGKKVSLHAKLQHGQWQLAQAEQAAVVQGLALGQLLEDLRAMAVKRVASSKRENHARFSVAAAGSVQLVLKNRAGEVLLDVFIGKPATDLLSTYIRLAQSDTVMTVDKMLTWQVKRTPKAWLKEENKDES